MNKSRLAIALFVIVFLLGVAGTVLAALDAAAPGSTFRQGDPAVKGGITLAAADTAVDNELHQSASCRQIVVNPQLNVIETGPSTGTAEPWYFMKPIIYYIEEVDGAYDGYSLVLPDGDDGDPSPTSDILRQIVTLDKDLLSVTVAYQRGMIDSNPTDKVYGELWRLAPDGTVDLNNPGQYRITRWQVSDSEKVWAKEVKKLDNALLDDLSGQEIALLLRTETNGGGASEAEKERVLFDDVTITSCIDDAVIFLPVIRSK